MITDTASSPQIDERNNDRPAPRARRRDAAENRDAILAAAAIALNRDPSATLEIIAAEAGLSRRALYGHFANRDDLILELLTRRAARIATRVLTVDHHNSRIAIAQIGGGLWREIENVRVMAQFAVRGPFMGLVGETLAPTRALLFEVVDRGIRAGQLRQDMPADLLARLVEGAALAVLDEASHNPLGSDEGARLVMAATLGMAGLSWAESTEVIGLVLPAMPASEPVPTETVPTETTENHA
ncbi:MAG: transcriptional regulator, TetR family [Glaciihabitans sp.]|nr:transcriptional regulator, TetR family [Glaciihabitans sp.]